MLKPTPEELRWKFVRTKFVDYTRYELSLKKEVSGPLKSSYAMHVPIWPLVQCVKWYQSVQSTFYVGTGQIQNGHLHGSSSVITRAKQDRHLHTRILCYSIEFGYQSELRIHKCTVLYISSLFLSPLAVPNFTYFFEFLKEFFITFRFIYF